MMVRERIEKAAETLTIGERKLAATILSDYPFSGLSPIHELARRSEVSAPSISRFVTKIGLDGYQDFQRELMSELKQGLRSPLDLHAPGRAVEGGFLKDFIAKATSQMAIAADAITEEQFTRICNLLTDPRRRIYVRGGRSSNTIAEHLTFHLRLIRKDVHHLLDNAEMWPDDLLRMRQGDLLYLVDFRRYEPGLEQLACHAAQTRNARIVLMTDKWISPIAKHAHEVMPVPIESGTLWDTYSAALAVSEAIVTHIAEHNWDKARARMQAWETLRLTSKDDPT